MGIIDVARDYCEIRLMAGGISLVVIGVVLMGVALYILFSSSLDTSNYIETTGNVVKISKYEQQTNEGLKIMYDYVIEYKIDNVVYTTTNRDFVGDKMTVTLYYNPSNPNTVTYTRDSENSMGMTLILVALVMLSSGSMSIYFKNNSIACGATIASDISSIIKRRFDD